MAFQKVHTAVGLVIWAFVMLFRPSTEFAIASFIVLLVGSTLPDADLMFQPLLKHRGLSHTIRAALVYTALVALASSWLLMPGESVLLSLLALISYMSHLLFDSHIKF